MIAFYYGLITQRTQLTNTSFTQAESEDYSLQATMYFDEYHFVKRISSKTIHQQIIIIAVVDTNNINDMITTVLYN